MASRRLADGSRWQDGADPTGRRDKPPESFAFRPPGNTAHFRHESIISIAPGDAFSLGWGGGEGGTENRPSLTFFFYNSMM